MFVKYIEVEKYKIIYFNFVQLRNRQLKSLLTDLFYYLPVDLRKIGQRDLYLVCRTAEGRELEERETAVRGVRMHQEG